MKLLPSDEVLFHRTGRTSAQLREAAHCASEGRNVVYFVPSWMFVPHIVDVLRTSFGGEQIPGQNTVRFNGATIRVAPINLAYFGDELTYLMAGLRNTVVRFDHSVLEQYSAHLEKKYSKEENGQRDEETSATI